MPKGTRVEKCFTAAKRRMPTGQAAAICQSSTGQSLATGKSIPKKKSNGRKPYKKGNGK